MDKINQFLSKLLLNDEQLNAVTTSMLKEINKGLNKTTDSGSELKMLLSYVTSLPTGNETGQYLALDLGGTNFRVLLVTLDQGKLKIENEKFTLPEELMTGSGKELFDYFSQCLVSFTLKHKIGHKKLPLGFTFSFPCKQDGLDAAKLIKWTKGFNASDVEGRNVAQLLREAIERNGAVDIDIVAVTNDTTGTLVSGAFHDKNCHIGLIVGTGSNACYMETLDNLKGLDQKHFNAKEMIMNAEWGSFGDHGSIDFVLTKYDREIDQNSLNPSHQIFEKMISGMYLGEFVRLILIDLFNEDLLPLKKLPDTLLEKYSFHTEYVSMCEKEEANFELTRKILVENLKIQDVPDEVCRITKHICQVISTRSAHLVASGLVALLKKVNRPEVTIGFDGSVMKLHPHFQPKVEQKIKELMPYQKFKMLLSEDGSGLGAALIVSTATSS